MLERKKFFIDGKWVVPSTSNTITVINPANEEIVGISADGAPADMDRAVAAARAAFDAGPWPRMSPQERIAILKKVADHLRPRAEEITELLIDEMGVVASFAHASRDGVAGLIDYYTSVGAAYPFVSTRQGMNGKVIIREEPVGVAALIVPWNAPLSLLMLKCAPALMAGCTVIAKPAPETPLDAFYLAEAAEAAGLPPGVLNIVPAGREAGEHLVRHPGVDKVSFTGSTAAGRKIASICGEHLKRCNLELGGKSAGIVLDDADVQTVINSAIPFGLAFNNGEACAALTRILVPRKRYGEFVDAFAAATAKVAVGDPRDPKTQVGPVVAERQRTRIEGYIRSAHDEGAKLLVGGKRPKHLPRGWYVEPTVFADVTNQMKIAREEVFGPVAVLIPYEGGDDVAIKLANDSPYGLAGSVYTENPARGYEVAKQVRSGIFGVNTYAIDITCPFGGYKASGIGREMGPEGLKSFLETKSVFGLTAPPSAN